LKWYEVKELFKRACDKIDPQGGGYDADGHSQKYGYGRLNALTAVELARPQARSGISVSRDFDAPIPDLQTVSFDLTVPDDTVVEGLTVSVDIKHTYIGDLVIALHPPSETGITSVLLHDRSGGATKNLKRIYDVGSTPEIAGFAGKNCSGIWSLEITDSEVEDNGTLVSFGINLLFTHPSRAARTI
jgi:subtilisin-like proprotein convertase family protein